MTSHIIQDSKYAGDFAELLEAYRAGDANAISLCEDQASGYTEVMLVVIVCCLLTVRLCVKSSLGHLVCNR